MTFASKPVRMDRNRPQLVLTPTSGSKVHGNPQLDRARIRPDLLA